jgi:hypothetical protein
LRAVGGSPQEKKPEASRASETTDKTPGKPAVAAGNCSEGWQSIAAKVPGSKVVLRLSTTKEGQKQLQWSPHTDFVTKLIYESKGPANAKGEIEMCSVGNRSYAFTNANSISLQDLRKAEKLPLGYYAIRVIIWSNEYDPTTPTGKRGDNSDWITIQIE